MFLLRSAQARAVTTSIAAAIMAVKGREGNHTAYTYSLTR